MQPMKGTGTEMQGVEMIMKPRCTEEPREWGRKKQGKRKSLTHGGYELVMWTPEEGFKTFLIYQFIIHICVYLAGGSVMCSQFTCGHIKPYMKCVLQVRLSIPSCEM